MAAASLFESFAVAGGALSVVALMTFIAGGPAPVPGGVDGERVESTSAPGTVSPVNGPVVGPGTTGPGTTGPRVPSSTSPADVSPALPASQAPAVQPPAAQPPAPAGAVGPEIRSYPAQAWGSKPPRGAAGYDQPRKKKKGSFLSELFEM